MELFQIQNFACVLCHIVTAVQKHLCDHHTVNNVCHRGNKQPGVWWMLQGLLFEMAAPECEHQREKNKSASRCNLSSLWHLSSLLLTFYIRSEREEKILYARTHKCMHTHTHTHIYCIYIHILRHLFTQFNNYPQPMFHLDWIFL